MLGMKLLLMRMLRMKNLKKSNIFFILCSLGIGGSFENKMFTCNQRQMSDSFPTCLHSFNDDFNYIIAFDMFRNVPQHLANLDYPFSIIGKLRKKKKRKKNMRRKKRGKKKSKK